MHNGCGSEFLDIMQPRKLDVCNWHLLICIWNEFAHLFQNDNSYKWTLLVQHKLNTFALSLMYCRTFYNNLFSFHLLLQYHWKNNYGNYRKRVDSIVWFFVSWHHQFCSLFIWNHCVLLNKTARILCVKKSQFFTGLG